MGGAASYSRMFAFREVSLNLTSAKSERRVCIDEVKNACCYISNSPYIFMEEYLFKHRFSFT